MEKEREEITIQHELTDDETLALSRKVADLQLQLADKEDAKKATATQYKAEIEELQAEIKLLSRNIRDGWMNKTIYCEKVKDTVRGKWLFYDGDGKIVKKENMSQADYQLELQES